MSEAEAEDLVLEAAPAGAVPLGEEQFSDEAIAAFLGHLSTIYDNVDGQWAGFVPAEHPVIVNVMLEDRSSLGLIAINYPTPETLGEPTEVSVDGMPFTSVHKIVAVNDDDARTLEEVPFFDFHLTVGGVDSFVINAGTDAFFNLTTPDYASTLIHELFHRYQDQRWSGFESVGQDVEGYDYGPENLVLATLEERALAAAIDSTSTEELEKNARYFAALRLARLQRDDRVQLDDAQEAVEGSARYIEHVAAGDSENFVYHLDNFSRDLTLDLQTEQVKDFFGFGRWYASGAAGLSLLDRLGVENVDSRLGEGVAISAMLADALGVADDDIDRLVAEARQAFDPQNELAEPAEVAAQVATTEPGVFGDDVPDGEFGEEFEEGDFEDGVEITGEELECLEQEGFDLETDTEISDALAQKCFADAA